MEVFKRNPKRYWLFPIILLTVVFVLFGYFSCRRTGEQFHEDNMNSLSYVGSSLSDSLTFGDALSVEFVSIPELETLGRQTELKGTSLIDLKKVSDTLARTLDINQMVESIYVYFARSDKVLTRETLYDLNSFYDRDILKQCDTKNLAFWCGCRRVKTGGLSYVRGVNVLTIIRRIPYNLFSADDLVVINLNMDRLLSGFSRYEQVFMISGSAVISAGGYEDTTDRLREQLAENTLTGSNGTRKLSGEYLYYRLLDSSSIYCAILVPESRLIDLCLPDVSVLLLIYAASLFVIFFLMHLFSRVTNRRSRDLIRKIGDGIGSPIPEEHDPSAVLDDAIDRLITTNRQMTESEEKYISLIRSTVIADIILGHAASDDKLAEHLEYCGLSFDLPYFTGFVCLTTIDDTNLQNDASTAYSVTLFIRDLIEQELSHDCRVYFHTSLDNRIYFFINHSISYETLNALVKTSLHRVNVLAQSDYDVSLLFFTGPCVDSITKVAHSCYTAGRLLDTYRLPKVPSSHDDSPSPCASPAHPTAIAEQLISGFRKNSWETVAAGLNAFFCEYLLPAALPLEMSKNITCILVTGVINEIWQNRRELHINEMTGYLGELASVAAANDLKQKTLELLKGLFEQSCEASGDDSYIVKYVPTVIEYIKSNYYKDLSIADIASCVDLNPRYLGELFKEATGQTLIQYLNMVRIDCAKGLLCETDATLREIAEKIGYNGTHAFIRHFKASNNGITPTEYRDAHSGQ